jgi:NADPH-dependent curcumin reductase CurA
MSPPTQTRVWSLQIKPTSNVILSSDSNATFKLETKQLRQLKDGEILTQTLFLSNDPAQRGGIDASIPKERLYAPPVEVGQTMSARGILKVLSSTSSSFKEGDLVVGSSGWSEFNILSANYVQPVRTDIPNVSPTQFLGALGMTGITAYVGLVNIVEAKKGETMVVSGAAGATGSMVVQIAKNILGLSKVVGIAGTDEKCAWVKSLGADECINYKKSDWKEKLIAATDGFVDVYFDNVGGEQLDLMLTRLKTFGRIAACGAVSDYNNSHDQKSGLKNWSEIIMQRLQIKGFIVMDHIKDGKAAKIVGELAQAAKEGKINVSEENEFVVDTKFEDVPKTWTLLFEGANRGKLVTKIV